MHVPDPSIELRHKLDIPCLVHVALEVLRGPVTADLLRNPRHKPHCPLWAQTKGLEDTHGLQRNKHGPCVVHGTLPHIPAVDVASNQHHLFWPLITFQFSDGVPAGGHGMRLAFHVQADPDLLPADLHPLQHLHVLHRKACCRHSVPCVVPMERHRKPVCPRQVLRLDAHPRVGGGNREPPSTTNQGRHAAQFGHHHMREPAVLDPD
mmetsp:Transcript_137761/g.239566  ORF Transcript_137761/g.239566 Transcript_137761/m.239566 type:complete len:207 (+) Transcript_137761:1099-1719(+)